MKKTVVCFGDSNTHGYCSENGGRFDITERFPGVLKNYLGDDYLICEEGMCGRTAAFEDPLFEGLNGFRSIYPCIMTHEPVDLLIIMLGTNDVKERFGATAANIAKGLERLTKKAIASKEGFRDGEPNILIICPAPIDERYKTTYVINEMGKDCDEKSLLLSPYYKEMADQLGCHFLDAGAINGIKMHPNDYMHLDKASHTLLALKLAEIIPTLL